MSGASRGAAGRRSSGSAQTERQQQRASGSFYTPSWLVETLLYRRLQLGPPHCAGSAPLTVLDPACGDGQFLATVARLLPRARLVGIELNPAALQLARARVPRLEARQADALAPEVGPPPGSVDLVVGNPPFVRCRALDPRTRSRLRTSYSTARGAFNLAVPFVERAVEWLRPGGRLALILPNKLLIASYARALRELLCSQTVVEQIVDLSDDQTFDAAAYPIALLATRAAPPPAHRLTLVQTRVDKSSDRPRLVETASRQVAQTPELLGAPAQVSPVVEQVLAQDLPQLGEIVRPREGLHTGNVRERLVHQGPAGPLDRPLLRGRDCGRYALSWRGLWVRADPSLVRRDLGEYANFPAPQVFAGPKLLLREISRRPAACLDTADHWTLNKVYPLQEHAPLDEQQRYALLGLLNSEPFFQLFRCLYRATHLRGGHLQFKAQYVQRTPIPPLDRLLSSGIGDLARQRMGSSSSSPAGQRLEQLERALDRAAEKAYGLEPVPASSPTGAGAAAASARPAGPAGSSHQ